MSSVADRATKVCSVRFCYMPLGLFGTEVHAEVRPPWVALSKGLRLPLLRESGRLRQNERQELRYSSEIFYSNAPWVRYLYVPRIVVALCAHAEQAAMVRLPC